jgi:hypothetical protein
LLCWFVVTPERCKTPRMPPISQNDSGPAPSLFDAFRREVMSDEALQAELMRPFDPAAFVALAVARACERQIDLEPDDFWRRLRPNESGSAGQPEGAELAAGWPPVGWLPSSVGPRGSPYVDWAHFAGEPLAEPSYEQSSRNAMGRPFNGVFGARTSLAALVDGAPSDRRRPAGLIFHLSRCGSTLAAQMLAAVPAYTVVSEAPPIDEAVRLETAAPQDRAGFLAAMVAAVGRRRYAAERRLFVKLDSWHVLAGALFQSAFAGTPWVFIYRDPLEVLVSQIRQRGAHTVRGVLPAAIFGIASSIPDDEYCAIVLRRTCEAALSLFARGGGRLVNYADLPAALATQILPHFGEAPSAAERALMAPAARRDAKTPWQAFAPDGEAKLREASPRLRQLVEQHLARPYLALEALRLAGAPEGAR